MSKYILASSNQNKYIEIASRLSNITLLSLVDVGHVDEIIESGLTLKDNALIKAKTIYEKYNTPSISDDTGLEVHALNGKPGVFSARYAGEPSNAEQNIKKLLLNLNQVQDRRARFRTVICLKTSISEVFFEGVVEGVITTKTMGQGGFGYDPIFLPNGYCQTFSQMTLDEKNKISHRGVAVGKLVTYLNNLH
ncbi:MAG: non-canonical purine NTP pyrophosphatase, RdgB/HAM1 family [Flavobacteriales bacterium]|nr:non-canonical purine NTP pyrophosphatase, RdgB/HAM1 family [Flavobacteriales bacterium]